MHLSKAYVRDDSELQKACHAFSQGKRKAYHSSMWQGSNFTGEGVLVHLQTLHFEIHCMPVPYYSLSYIKNQLKQDHNKLHKKYKRQKRKF